MTIQEIQELNPIRPYCQETQGEADWYRIGLIDGLDAVSEIWHSPKEMPITERRILVFMRDDSIVALSGWGNDGSFCLGEGHWHYLKMQKAWCYVDDILDTIPNNLQYEV